jgi:hypothetical protein
MLRYTRLRDIELPLNGLDDLARCARTAGQQLQDASPNGVAENVEGLH